MTKQNGTLHLQIQRQKSCAYIYHVDNDGKEIYICCKSLLRDGYLFIPVQSLLQDLLSISRILREKLINLKWALIRLVNIINLNLNITFQLRWAIGLAVEECYGSILPSI